MDPAVFNFKLTRPLEPKLSPWQRRRGRQASEVLWNRSKSHGIALNFVEKALEGKAPVLKSAADAVALSAATGEAFQVTKQLTQLKEVLLAEHPDASNAARERCLRLRSGLATALRAALVQHPTGRRLLEGPSPPKVRIEVRHTAGRMLSEEVFTVGRAAECDVQTTGDPTCSRLQLLVISLPGGLCIADAWSNSGTRVVRREAQETLEASVPQHRKAFLLPHGERVTLMTGAKTTVSFGPAVKDLNLPRGSSEARK